MLITYNNTRINKIKIYAGAKGTYTINIYKGGTSSPTTLLYTKEYTITSSGINKLEISPMISLTDSQNLWITITNTHEEGEHPAGTSEGTSNTNARWRCINGSWYNDASNGWPDDCWMIQACLSNDTSKDGEFTEITLPQSPDSDPINKVESKEDVEANPPHCIHPN